jgi:transcriptional regulator with XRE-family HTH domain
MERKNAELIRSFAQALKARRKQAGLSQEEFAHRVDLSVSYVSLLETANRQPTLTVLAALAAEFGVSLAEFATEIEGQ